MDTPRSHRRSGRHLFYAALAVYAAAGIVLLLLRAGGGGVPESDLDGIPASLGEWTGSDIPLNDEVLDMVRPDAHVFRNYRRGGEVVNVYLAFYRTIARSDLAHSPIICYRSQGWNIEARERVLLPGIGGAPPLRSTRMTVRKGGKTERVYFWYQTRNDSSAGLFGMRLRMLLNRFTGRDRLNVFVRVAGTCREPACAEAERAILDFLRRLRPHVDAVLR